MSDPLAIAKTTIKGLAAIIGEQRRELERLHGERDWAVEDRKSLVEKVEKLEALERHTLACHISTCPVLDGCEERDAGYLGMYMSHDCTCGLDAVRSALHMRQLRPPYYATEAEEQAANRAKIDEVMKRFHAAS
jgi:hypothetical protein